MSKESKENRELSAVEKHERALMKVKEAGNEYLETLFSEGDATLLIYVHNNSMIHAIKGKPEVVACLIYELMKNEPLLLKIIEANLEIIKKENDANRDEI
jgi:hypothetical protein